MTNEGNAAQWLAFQQIEPDMGTRFDWLMKLALLELTAIRASLGGKLPDEFEGKIIEWGKR